MKTELLTQDEGHRYRLSLSIFDLSKHKALKFLWSL